MSESDLPEKDDPSATSMGGAKRGSKKSGPKGILPIGFVLNGIYEVKRFLARGGMGEVYEGANVNSDERVAIKVILPHLAADPKVQAMFRKEAKTLTSLAHPALVQYRVLAREPRKDLLYIVTDFIDGEPLMNLIGRGCPTTYELTMLIRRLAEGLGAAHSHGAIHRDISPENVLLPGGQLSQAKIIDFGIAKSMETGAHTVVGDGFAGKLGYVAPEQFGDFGRNIGPWTDIYSLGLVALALAGGCAPDMGTTLVEAIDKRRAGPDISVVPDVLKPLFARMLAANPVDRPQSMAEVIQALDALNVPYEEPSALSRPPETPAAPAAPQAYADEARTIIGPAVLPSSSWGASPSLSSPPAEEAPASSWGAVPEPSAPPSEPASSWGAAAEPPAPVPSAPPAPVPAADEGPKTIFSPNLSALTGGRLSTPPTPAPEPPAAEPEPPAPEPVAEVAPPPPPPPPPPEPVVEAPPPPPPAPELKPEPPPAPKPAPAPVPASGAEKPAKPEKPVKAEKPPKPPPPPKPPKPEKVQPTGEVGEQKKKSPIGLIAAGLAAVVVLGGGGFLLMNKNKGPSAPAPGAPAAEAPQLSADAAAALAPVETALGGALQTVDCAWLVMNREAGSDGSITLRVSGAAADPTAVNKAVASSAEGARAANAQIDTAKVLAAPRAACPLLNTVKGLRPPQSVTAPALVAQQAQFEINRGIQGCPATGLWAQSMVNFSSDPGKSFALIGVEPSGRLQQLVASREQFLTLAKQAPDRFRDLGGGRYRVSMCQSEQGLAGLLMVEGVGPFDTGLRTGAAVRPPAGFADKLRAAAEQKGWTMQMAWFRQVNNQPDLPESTVAANTPTSTPVGGTTTELNANALANGAPPPSPTAPPAPPPPNSGPVATQEWVACRRFLNGAWEEAGYGSRTQCIQRIFTGHCEVATGQSGLTQLRRYNGFIQGREDRRGANWNNLSPDACPR